MKHIIFGLLACVALAHKDFEDSADPDSYLLTGREGAHHDGVDLDTSFLASGVPTKMEDYVLTQKFSDESDFTERGKVLVARNEKTDEILKVEIVEKPYI